MLPPEELKLAIDIHRVPPVVSTGAAELLEASEYAFSRSTAPMRIGDSMAFRFWTVESEPPARREKLLAADAAPVEATGATRFGISPPSIQGGVALLDLRGGLCH